GRLVATVAACCEHGSHADQGGTSANCHQTPTKAVLAHVPTPALLPCGHRPAGIHRDRGFLVCLTVGADILGYSTHTNTGAARSTPTHKPYPAPSQAAVSFENN